LRKYKINSPKFAEILNKRSKSDGVIHAPGVATTSVLRCGTRRIAPKHHEELWLWLAGMKEGEEGEVEEEEEEEEEEEQEKSTGDEVAEIFEDQEGEEGEEGEEDEEKESELETHREKRQRIAAASSQQAPGN
jgi:hypothetical protein